jgi:hypothetical protein
LKGSIIYGGHPETGIIAERLVKLMESVGKKSDILPEGDAVPL